jgi:hypothetical protein
VREAQRIVPSGDGGQVCLREASIRAVKVCLALLSRSSHNIGKDSGCCYLGTCTWALNYQWLWRVAPSSKGYDVIAARKRAEGVFKIHSCQSNASSLFDTID